MKGLTRHIQNKRGSVLLLVVGTLSAICLFGSLMLSKYGQNAIAVRNPASLVELSGLVQQVQQSINNPNLCSSSSAFLGQTITNPPNASSTTQLLTVTQIVATPTPGASSITIAAPGMKLNGVSIASSEQSYSAFGFNPLQITAGSHYQSYGPQPSPGPSLVQGLNCTQANLHVVTSKEASAAGPSTSSSGPRKTLGLILMQEDIPITLLTNNMNQIQGCFGGSAANICVPSASSASASFVLVGGPCVDNLGTSTTVTWGGTNISSATLVCNGNPIPISAPATFATGGVSIFNGPVPTGANVTCVLTPINSLGASGAPMASNTFNSQTTACTPSTITLSSPACVNTTDASFIVGWTDSNTSTTITVVANGSSQPSSTAGGTGNLTFSAPFAVGTIPITATDAAGGTASPVTTTVMAPPTIASFSSDVVPGGTFSTGNGPASVTLSWVTANADKYDISAGGIPVATGITTTSFTLPSVPTATTTYTLTAYGGCSDGKTTTSTVTITVTPNCGKANNGFYAATPTTPLLCTDGTSGLPVTSAGPLFTWSCGPNTCKATNTGGGSSPTCGSANGTSVPTAPSGAALCSDGTTTPPVLGTGPWNWTCGTTSCAASPSACPSAVCAGSGFFCTQSTSDCSSGATACPWISPTDQTTGSIVVGGGPGCWSMSDTECSSCPAAVGCGTQDGCTYSAVDDGSEYGCNQSGTECADGSYPLQTKTIGVYSDGVTEIDQYSWQCGSISCSYSYLWGQ